MYEGMFSLMQMAKTSRARLSCRARLLIHQRPDGPDDGRVMATLPVWETHHR